MTEIAEQLSCQELVELVTDYLEGALPPAERARFDAHIALCDGCRAYLEQIRATIALSGRSARAARPGRGSSAARGFPRLEAQTVGPGLPRHLSGEPGGGRAPASTGAALELPARPGVSPGSTICRDAPRCSARPRPAASGTCRRRGAETGSAARALPSPAARSRRRSPRVGSTSSAASRPTARTRPASRRTRRHEQLAPGSRPAASGRPRDGRRVSRPGLRRGRLRAGSRAADARSSRSQATGGLGWRRCQSSGPQAARRS